MRLLDLPLEIIDLIIDRSTPEGLESFALSCTSVYQRARPRLQHHNASKRRWGSTTNASRARRGDTLALLHEIAREPRIARYIESLSLWDRRAEEDVADADATPSFRDSVEAMNSIKDLLHHAEYFANADLEQWWTQILLEDQRPETDGIDKLCATIALLSLLPNLRQLQLPDRWHEVRESEAAEELVPAVESLVAMANTKGPNPRALGSLETILPFVEEGYDVRVGLQCLQPNMVLNSIRNLYAVSCVAVQDDWAGIPFNWPNPSLKSPLTRIEFACCCMDASALSVLLANTPSLTVFKYSHQSKWDGLEFDWNPGAFLEVIANHTGDRLLELALTIDELHGEIVNGLSSFMRFPKLEVLEVDVETFCGPPVESGQRRGRDGFVPEGAAPWTYMDIPCMGDMLPESIRELHVNTNFPRPSVQALLSLFKNIKDRRLDKLTNLKVTVIRQYRANTAQEIATSYGVTLEAFDKDVENPRPRSMMPLWKRRFDDTVGGIVMSEE
ncbi:hypothetical protein LEMA_P011440.1 [Plenodomus lingam JN3]|uniref:F-box domain-containing protein n=1 Tax=Leptosphaeria maculans (strain JN3 / isolate v23.1.3 / race Av1-4-5-6-7-8) TaxID=985895 RepID=E5AD05_LEPMJ|nr:hypothetical protein LEMA_P011440.1 [Plenodomus lingam JN3]CBY02357.1 hypothetical protein LEMA_P011440.1 [Plenodomus lingam JN3]